MTNGYFADVGLTQVRQEVVGDETQVYESDDYVIIEHPAAADVGELEDGES